jgi:hypothetical protein
MNIRGRKALWGTLIFSLAVSGCGGDDGSGGGTPPPPPSLVVPPPPPPPTSQSLIDAAKAFPAMPRDSAQLLQARGGGSLTFGSGTPFNDLEYTIFDTDYMEGETTGFDTFMPVDPSRTFPGENQIKLINTVNNLDLDTTYEGDKGDRIILGTADVANPFFLSGSDGVDNDYVVVTNFDYNNGGIQLRGNAADYGMVLCTTANGCASSGYYLFHTAGSRPDLVAFISQCDDIALPISGNAPRNPNALCNTSKELSLSNSSQFSFATAVPTTPAIATGAVQFGTSGKEVVGGITSDTAGNTFTVGLTDGNLDGGASADNEIFITRHNANGNRAWTREIALPNGSLLFDVVADSSFVYAVGRTLGALPGFTNAGRWDGIIVKMNASDGVVVATTQFGNEGLDGFGNVTLDDAGNLYVSGAGSPPGPAGTDSEHLVAKYRASDLSRVWTQIVPPAATGQIFVAEAWGGITYVPGTTPGNGRLVTGGWYMSAGGSNGFMEVWEGLNNTSPTRAASTTISSANNQADWVLDNVVDSAGNIYAVGFTTGSLQGTHRGRGDAYIVRFDRNLQNPVFRQVGTAQADSFRRLRIDAAGNLYAVGYSYGDYAGTNAGLRRGDVIVQKFDASLNPVLSLQFGTPGEDRGYVDLKGSRLVIGGMTEGSLARASAGSFDAFFVDIDPATLRLR